jgi:RHS repeat-associated protein
MTSRDGVWDYTYDATGQLTRATFTSSNAEIPSRDIGYVYDKVGNRVREIVNGATKDYGVTAMNQYSQAGTLSYTYDPDGNLTGKTDGTDTWAYAYNDDNRLIRSSGPDGEKEYIYNGLGHLAAVIADGVKHDYTVDPFGYGNVMAEYDTAGNLASRYTHGLGLVAKDDNFYTFDGNGNTSEMTNAANEIVNFYLYEPFGKTLYDVETTDNDFQFVGQLGVRQMGDDLVYMRNRFFMPSLGRFFSEDPIGLAGGDVSFYRYVSNDPVNWVDPTGLLNLGKAVAGALTVTDGMTMVGVGIAGTVAAGIASGGNPYVTGAVGLIMVPVVGAGAYDIYHGAHVFWEGLWEKEDDSDCH